MPLDGTPDWAVYLCHLSIPKFIAPDSLATVQRILEAGKLSVEARELPDRA